MFLYVSKMTHIRKTNQWIPLAQLLTSGLAQLSVLLFANVWNVVISDFHSDVAPCIFFFLEKLFPDISLQKAVGQHRAHTRPRGGDLTSKGKDTKRNDTR